MFNKNRKNICKRIIGGNIPPIINIPVPRHADWLLDLMKEEFEMEENSEMQEELISTFDENKNIAMPLTSEGNEKIVQPPNLKKQISTIMKYLSMLIVGLANLLYSGTEILFSTKPFTGSLSLLGDGIHNLSDVLTLIIAFWAERVNFKFFFNFSRLQKLKIQKLTLMECKEQSSLVV
jgi:hypothetical protein